MGQESVPGEAGRIEGIELAGARVHGLDLEGATVTDAFLRRADISGDIEGLRLNGVEVEPLVRDELDRRFPERLVLRAEDVAGLRAAWSMLEERWAATTDRAARLPDDLQRRRVDGEWSFAETLRHLVFATDSWVSRAILLARRPYHPWGLPWGGAGQEFAEAVGVDAGASPGLAEVRPVREERQRTVRDALDSLSDAALGELRTPPDEPGHPTGPHTVLHCLHVVLDEEWEHHRYAVRDLSILEGDPVADLSGH